ncbi:hypothetical protein BKA70DRAFT_1232480 [Coprinopsis sp. MPI-PUGE-AT-0042]|nr:hypothetical protein BKA70DRAFT_1232480 [Coprinopsis sp. MPI-PUGE-AT-0042]
MKPNRWFGTYKEIGTWVGLGGVLMEVFQAGAEEEFGVGWVCLAECWCQCKKAGRFRANARKIDEMAEPNTEFIERREEMIGFGLYTGDTRAHKSNLVQDGNNTYKHLILNEQDFDTNSGPQTSSQVVLQGPNLVQQDCSQLPLLPQSTLTIQPFGKQLQRGAPDVHVEDQTVPLQISTEDDFPQPTSLSFPTSLSSPASNDSSAQQQRDKSSSPAKRSSRRIRCPCQPANPNLLKRPACQSCKIKKTQCSNDTPPEENMDASCIFLDRAASLAQFAITLHLWKGPQLLTWFFANAKIERRSASANHPNLCRQDPESQGSAKVFAGFKLENRMMTPHSHSANVTPGWGGVSLVNSRLSKALDPPAHLGYPGLGGPVGLPLDNPCYPWCLGSNVDGLSRPSLFQLDGLIPSLSPGNLWASRVVPNNAAASILVAPLWHL